MSVFCLLYFAIKIVYQINNLPNKIKIKQGDILFISKVFGFIYYTKPFLSLYHEIKLVIS